MDAAVALKDNLLAFASARLTTVDPVAVLSTVLILMGVYLVMFVAAAGSPLWALARVLRLDRGTAFRTRPLVLYRLELPLAAAIPALVEA